MYRTIAALLAPLLLIGCADPAAVRSFAAAGPPAGSYTGMIAFYSNHLDPGVRRLAALKRGACPIRLPTPGDATAARGPDLLHKSWRAYMAALGRLADNKPVAATGPAVGTLKSGLTTLRTGFPHAGLTTSEVTRASDLAQLLADLLTRGIRQDALRSVLKQGQPAFQSALAIETTMIQRIYLPDLKNYRSGYANFDTQQRHEPGRFMAAKPTPEQDAPPFRETAAQTGCLALQVLGGGLPAPSEIATRIAAAHAYVTALGKLALAHTALYRARDQILWRATYTQVAPAIKDADAAWADFTTATATK